MTFTVIISIIHLEISVGFLTHVLTHWKQVKWLVRVWLIVRPAITLFTSPEKTSNMRVPKNSLSKRAVIMLFKQLYLPWLTCSFFHSADWCSPAVYLAPVHFLWPVTFLSLNCETHGNQNNAPKSQTGLVFLLSTDCSSQCVRKSLLSHPMSTFQSRPCLKRLHPWWLLQHSFQKWKNG